MKTHQWGLGCAIAFAAMMLASCTQGQIEQVLQTKTQDMISGPCPPGSGPVSAAPEFCLYVTEMHVVNHDTEADVSLTIANRTGRRLRLVLPFNTPNRPYLTDNSGTKWDMVANTGIPVRDNVSSLSLEPNIPSPVALHFQRSGQGPADLTFSLRGEIEISKTDSRGELIPGYYPQAIRGFTFSGLGPQQPAQPAAAMGGPRSDGQSPSTSSAGTTVIQSSKAAVVTAPETAHPLQESTASQQQSRPGLKVSGVTPVPNGYTIPTWAERLDIVGVKVGMPANQAVEALKAYNPNFKLETQEVQLPNVSGLSLWVVKGTEKFDCCSVKESIVFRNTLPPQPTVVTEVMRWVIFEKGKQPSIASILEALKSKYGNDYVQIKRDPEIYIWRLDGQRVLQPGSTQGGCYYDLDPIAPLRRSGSIEQGPDFRAQPNLSSYASSCGVVVSAHIGQFYENPLLAAQLAVRVSSEPFGVSTFKNTMDYLVGLEQARRIKEGEQHKGLAPKM